MSQLKKKIAKILRKVWKLLGRSSYRLYWRS